MRSFFRHRPSTTLPAPHRIPGSTGFSLLEMLVTIAVVGIILVSVMQFVSDVERTWKTASNDPFAEAGDAFSQLAQNLASATLEPYQDYADSGGAFHIDPATSFVPHHLARRSDLDFVCGPCTGPGGLLTTGSRITSGCGVFFVEPRGYTQTYTNAGLGRLLNATGYFVEFGDDDGPAFLSSNAHRWRLREIQQPAESLQIFALPTSAEWIAQLAQPAAPTSVAADNIVTLIVLPERNASDTGTPLTTDFRYDSRDAGNALTRHQLPPRLRLALVAIDEPSAQILASKSGTNPPALVPGGLFQQAAQLDADLASLDATLTAQKIGHRIFQREIQLGSSAWSNIPSQ